MAITGVGALILSAWAVRLLKETLAATRKTLIEAEKATALAQETVSVTREIGQAQVRAYPHITDVKVVDDGTDGETDTIIAFIFIENSGSTPSIDTSVYLSFRYYPSGRFALETDRTWVMADEKTGSINASGMTIMSAINLPADVVHQVRAGFTEVEIAVMIRYHDVFKFPHEVGEMYYLCGPNMSAPLPVTPRSKQIKGYGQ